MRFVLIIICLVFFSACTPKDTKTPSSKYGLVDNSEITITIEKIETGLWRAHYVFAKPQTALFFSLSHNDYRTKSWKSLNKGVRLERVAGFDAILLDVPATKASFEFAPYSGKVRREYTPFIPFSDGGVAVYTGQFEVLPTENRDAIKALGGSLQNWQGEQGPLAVRILSDEKMIKDGNIVQGEALDISTIGGGYIYVGSAEITEGQDFSGVVDPGLPDWIKTRFDKDLSVIFDGLRNLWGEGLAKKSTVLFSFRGYDLQGFLNKGGALGSMLALEVSGSNMRTENKSSLRRIHWFFAHEAVHLFQTRHNTELSNSDDAWISEGGANAMANMVLYAQGLVDEAYIFSEYAQEYDQCIDYLKTSILSNSIKKGKYDIHYACGDLMALITDGALTEHNLFDFWNMLIVKTKQKNAYSADVYFAVMEDLGAPENIISGLKTLAYERVANPDNLLKSLLQDSGLNPKFDQAGNLISLKFP